MSHIFHFIGHGIWMTVNLLAVTLLVLAGLSMVVPPNGGGFLLYPFSLLPAVVGLGFEWLVYINLFFALSWLFTHRKLWGLVSVLALIIVFPALRNTWALNSSPKIGWKSQSAFGSEKGRLAGSQADRDSARSGGGVDRSAEAEEYETSAERGSINRGVDNPAGGSSLTLLTYNTHLLQNSTPIEQNELLRYVKSSGADIVCMQEYAVYKDRRYPSFEGVKRYMKDEYPYTYYDFSVHNKRLQYGLAVYSKYPIINKNTIPFDASSNGANRCDIVVNSDTFRLITNHLQSNLFTPQEVDSLMMLPLHRSAPNSSLSKLSTAYAKRTKQVAKVRAEIDASPYPVIVCGDFNDVPVSYTYRQLSRGLSDAFLTGADSRFALGHTYVRHHLGIRIDYILHSPSFRASDFRIDPLPYSDHYPIRTTLRW